MVLSLFSRLLEVLTVANSCVFKRVEIETVDNLTLMGKKMSIQRFYFGVNVRWIFCCSR